MQNHFLEFRVLTGLQVGARIRLPSGSYTLGNDLDCDIVVQGQGIETQHLILHIDEEQILLRPIAHDCGTEHGPLSQDSVLVKGQLFRAARIWLQVADTNAPWPESDTIFAADDNLKTETADTDRALQIESSADTGSQDDQAKALPVTTTPVLLASEATPLTAAISTDEAREVMARDDTSVKRHHAVSTRTRWRIGILSVSMLAAVFLGGIAISLMTPGAATTAAQQPSSDKYKDAMHEGAIACTNGVTTKLGLSKQINVINDGKAQSKAVGFLAKNRELAEFQNDMRKLCPTVQLAVSADDTLSHQVKAALGRQNGGWTLHSVRQGRALVSRVGTGAPSLSELQTKLLREIDGLAAVEQFSLDLAGVKLQLDTMLEQAKLAARISAVVKDNRLLVSGDPTSTEAARWEPILEQLRQKHGADLPLTVEFENRRNALPFRIHQVVGGSMPFIVIDDGSRLFEGGTHLGYQLVSIKEHQLVFGGKQSIEISW